MRGIYIDTSGTIAEVEDDFTYGQLSSLVGGLLTGIATKDGQFGFANDEGIIEGLPINYPASSMCGQHLVGNVILLSVDSEGNSTSVPDAYIDALRDQWVVESTVYNVSDVLRLRDDYV